MYIIVSTCAAMQNDVRSNSRFDLFGRNRLGLKLAHHKSMRTADIASHFQLNTYVFTPSNEVAMDFYFKNNIFMFADLKCIQDNVQNMMFIVYILLSFES